MTCITELMIRPFHRSDQDATKALILDGLAEHWGWLDPTKNPDLDDIAEAYGQETFLVAWLDGELAGTGALIHEVPGVARVVRMSVARELRRRGVGRAILCRLLDAARERGYSRVVLETTSTWEDAKSFYIKNGFRPTGEWEGDAHFVMEIGEPS